MTKAAIDGKAARIVKWRESMATLPDARFFELMRVYLGEIKTPYNKQRLIESLAAFLRKERNAESLASMMDEFDAQMITALAVMPGATQQSVTRFFEGERTLAEIYTELSSLSDRLIIFKSKRSGGDEGFLRLNPLLEDALAPFIDERLLFKDETLALRFDGARQPVAPEFTAAFAACLLQNPDICKADGSIKKTAAERLEKIFPGRSECLKILLRSFINLGVVDDSALGKTARLSMERLESFAELSQKKQAAILCAASADPPLGLQGMGRLAQLLLDCAASIHDRGLSRAKLSRTALLLAMKSGAAEDGEREQGSRREFDSRLAFDITMAFDSIIDAAEELGIFSAVGKNSDGEKIYKTGPAIIDAIEKDDGKKTISVDASFTVTALPGLLLKSILPIVPFLDVVSCKTAVEFEITKRSIIRAFDERLSPSEICARLESRAMFPIPQNIKVSIDDWRASYSSAMVYKGYILKVDEKNSRIVEKNPRAAKFIREKLSDGIYLLDVSNDIEAREFTEESGIEIVGKVRAREEPARPPEFPLISDGENFSPRAGSAGRKKFADGKARAKTIKAMEAALAALKMPAAQREGLGERIKRRLILSPEQLRAATVRAEKLEAGGMDFAGKIRLIESAIASRDMLEIAVPAPRGRRRETLYFGSPLQIERKGGDSSVKMRLAPSGETKVIAVDKASMVRLLRSSSV